MSNLLSQKIRIASFLCTIMVVLRHSLNIEAFYNNVGCPQWLYGIEMGITRMTDIAVPFFFIVSGFFFSRNDYYRHAAYYSMLRKKTGTLLVPFLIWNLVGVLALLVYDKHDQLGHSVDECIINLLTSQWYGPLWYVRDLMILMVLVPIYGWLYIMDKKWLYAIVLVLLCYIWQPGTSSILSTEGIFFFALGGFLYRCPKIVTSSSKKWFGLFLLVIWMTVSFGVATWSNSYIHRLSILMGIVAFWQIVNILPIAKMVETWSFIKYSFLIYVMHFYMEKVFKFVLSYAFPENADIALLSYFTIPLAVVLLIVVGGGFVSRRFPLVYKIITGNRI